MDMPDTIGGQVLAFAQESDQPGVRADVRRLVIAFRQKDGQKIHYATKVFLIAHDMHPEPS
jgi:hypothetical protein